LGLLPSRRVTSKSPFLNVPQRLELLIRLSSPRRPLCSVAFFSLVPFYAEFASPSPSLHLRKCFAGFLFFHLRRLLRELVLPSASCPEEVPLISDVSSPRGRLASSWHPTAGNSFSDKKPAVFLPPPTTDRIFFLSPPPAKSFLWIPKGFSSPIPSWSFPIAAFFSCYSKPGSPPDRCATPWFFLPSSPTLSIATLKTLSF